MSTKTSMKIKTKIPTLADMMKNRASTTMDYSVEAVLRIIHGGLCARVEFVDFPFASYNEEDNATLETIIQELVKKDYKIQQIANIPQQQLLPQGMLNYHTIVHRIDLREITEPQFKFHDKDEKKTAKKIMKIKQAV